MTTATDFARAIAETFCQFVPVDGYDVVVFADGCAGVDVGPDPAVDPTMGHGVYAVLDRHHDGMRARIAPIVAVDGDPVVDTPGGVRVVPRRARRPSLSRRPSTGETRATGSGAAAAPLTTPRGRQTTDRGATMPFTPDPHPLARANGGPVPGCLTMALVFAAIVAFLWWVGAR